LQNKLDLVLKRLKCQHCCRRY